MSINVIGLTGPSGSGKSLLCDCLKELDIQIINADEVYHSLLAPNTECTLALVKAFGSEILGEDLSPDRKKLAKIVFNSPEKLSLLNSIVLDIVIKEIKKMICELDKAQIKNVIVDAPTLIESGFDKECHTVVSLLAPKDIRIERISDRDKLTKELAEQRINAQKPDSFYIDNSDLVLNNSYESPEEFKEYVLMHFGAILKK